MEKAPAEACAVLSFGEAVVVAVEVVVEDLVSLSCAAKSVRIRRAGVTESEGSPSAVFFSLSDFSNEAWY